MHVPKTFTWILSITNLHVLGLCYSGHLRHHDYDSPWCFYYF